MIVLTNFIPIDLAQANSDYDNSRAIYGYVENGNSYIPIGHIARDLGLEIKVHNEKQNVSIHNGEQEIVLSYNESTYIHNGTSKQLSQPTRLMNKILYTPTRDTLVALGLYFELTKESNIAIHHKNTKLLIHIKPITSAYNYSPHEIKVVMYHHFEENNNTPLIISPERFREHLNALLEAGYETITDEDLLHYKKYDWFKLPKKPLLITIDDGYYSQRLLDDFIQSRNLIKKHIGKDSISLSYPYGAFNNEIVQIANEAGFTFQITLQQNKNIAKTLSLISRVNASGHDSGRQLVNKLK